MTVFEAPSAIWPTVMPLGRETFVAVPVVVG